MRIGKWILLLVLTTPFGKVLGQEEQDTARITQTFQFNDGIYLSFESFQRNEPDISWFGLEASSIISDSKKTIKIDWLKRKAGDQDLIPMDSIWGICLNGLPYIQVENSQHPFGFFTAIRVRGQICYFLYESKTTEMVEIKAYNPLTRRPFRKANLPREVDIELSKMLHFESGVILPFNKENFLSWIEDDPELWRTVNGFDEKEAKEKLFKCLLIYDDRHPIYYFP